MVEHHERVVLLDAFLREKNCDVDQVVSDHVLAVVPSTALYVVEVKLVESFNLQLVLGLDPLKDSWLMDYLAVDLSRRVILYDVLPSLEEVGELVSVQV